MKTATQAQTNPKNAFTKRNRWIAYAFLLPNLIGFLAFTLIPIVMAFGLSFVKWDFANPMIWVGFKNFAKLFRDEGFQIAFWNTLYYTVISVPLTILFALLLAVLLHQKLQGVKLLRTIFFFPYISSMIAVAVVWNMLFHPSMGPINQLIRLLGVAQPPEWTSSMVWAMPAIIIVGVWKQVGYYMVIYLAALQAIPEHLYEAATIDGANAWQQFRKITLPLLTPATFFISTLLIINSFKVFDHILIMTDGGPGRATNVLGYYVYNQAFLYFKFGYASAVAMVLFLVVLIITLIQFKFENKWVNYHSV